MATLPQQYRLKSGEPVVFPEDEQPGTPQPPGHQYRLASGEPVVFPDDEEQPQTTQLGAGETAFKEFGQAATQIPKMAGMAASTIARAADATMGILGHQTHMEDAVFEAMDNIVRPMKEMFEFKPGERPSTAGQIAGGIASVPAAILSWPQHAIDVAQDMVNRGATTWEVVKAAGPQAVMDAAMNFVPFGVGAKMVRAGAGGLERVGAAALSGAGINLGLGATGRELQNVTTPNRPEFADLKQNVLPNPEQATVEALTGGIFGAAGAHPRVSPLDQLRQAAQATGISLREAGPGEVEHIEGAPAPQEPPHEVTGKRYEKTDANGNRYRDYPSGAVVHPEEVFSTLTPDRLYEPGTDPNNVTWRAGGEPPRGGMTAGEVEHITAAPAPKAEAPGLAPEAAEEVKAAPPPDTERQAELKKLLALAETPEAKKTVQGLLKAEQKRIDAEDAAAELRDLASKTTDTGAAATLQARAEKLAPTPKESPAAKVQPETAKPGELPLEQAAAPPEPPTPVEAGPPSPAPPAGAAPKAYTVGNSPFFQRVMDELGGIHKDERSDLGVDEPNQGKGVNFIGGRHPTTGKGRGRLFNSNGARMDRLTEWLNQNGYVSDHDLELAGTDAHELSRDLVNQEISKPGSVQPIADQGDRLEQIVRQRQDNDTLARAEQAGIETQGRSVEDVQHDLWKTEDHAHVQKHEVEPMHAADMADVQRAKALDENAVEDLARVHQDDTTHDAFMAGIRKVISDHAERNAERGERAESRPGGAAPEPEVRGEPARAGPVEAGEHAVRGEQGLGAPGAGERPETRPEVRAAGAERGNEAAAAAGEPLGATAVPRLATGENFANWLGDVVKRHEMEAEGQRILDDLEARDGNPQEVAEKFWKDTYWKLPANVQQRFRRMLAEHSGGGEERTLDVVKAAKKLDLDYHVEGLQGTERGFVALMDEANRRSEAPAGTPPPEPPLLENPTPEALRAKADAEERAFREKATKDNAPDPREFGLTGSNREADLAVAAGQKPLFIKMGEKGLGSLWGEGAKEAKAAAEAYKQKIMRTMDTHVAALRSTLDNLGLNWAHKDTIFGINRDIPGDAQAVYGNGHYAIIFRPATLDLSHTQIAHGMLHEAGHIVDRSGFAYSKDREWDTVRGKDGSAVPSGQISNELARLAQKDPYIGRILQYPFDAKYASKMDRDGVASELFAQAFALYNRPELREVLDREAPITSKFMADAIAHAAKEGHIPAGDKFFESSEAIRDSFQRSRPAGVSAGRAVPGGEPAARAAELGRNEGNFVVENRDTGEEVGRYKTLSEVRDHLESFPNDRLRPPTAGGPEVPARAIHVTEGESDSDEANRFAQILHKTFSRAQLKRMVDANAEEHRQLEGGEADHRRGLSSLPKEQREVMEFLSGRGYEETAISKMLGTSYKTYASVDRPKFTKDSSFGDSIAKVFAPASRGPIAEQQRGIMRSNFGEMAREQAVAHENLKTAAKQFDKMPVADNIAFTDGIERGKPQPTARLTEIAGQLRKLLDDRRDQIRAFGTGLLENFDENYFPHMWKRGDQAEAQALFGRRPLEGSKAFLKPRTIPLTTDGLRWRAYDADGEFIKSFDSKEEAEAATPDGGRTGKPLTPITSNPVEMALLKAKEMDRYIAGQRIFHEMKLNDLARPFLKRADAPQGWVRLNDEIANAGANGHYYAPEQAATLFNNHLSPGLQGNAFFDAWRGIGNSLNGLQLGLSLFHVGFTTMDTMVSKVALGIKQMSRGDIGKGLATAAQGVNPYQPISNVLKGDKLLRAYLGKLDSPEMAPIAAALQLAGGRVRMDDFYRNATVNAFTQAIRAGDKWGATKAFLPSLLDRLAKPIFEELVPRQKLGVFFDMAKDYMEAHPDVGVEDKIRDMGKMWDSVDNRMGQLVYDNVFWNRALKDTLMASVRSVGWNLGTFRELGGGVFDMKDVLKSKSLTDRSAYVIALPLLAGLYGAITQAAYGQGAPQDIKDLYFPRTGKTRPDGSQDRVSLPTYMKDVAAYAKDAHNFVSYGSDPTQTLKNKANPLVSTVSQMLQNEDFYGASIRNPADPAVKQIGDEAKYLLTQAEPFSWRNAAQQQQLQTGATPGPLESAARSLVSPSMFGITPAPGYVTKSPEEQESAQIARLREPMIRKFREELQGGADRNETIARMRASGLGRQDMLYVLKSSLPGAHPHRLKSFGASP